MFSSELKPLYDLCSVCTDLSGQQSVKVFFSVVKICWYQNKFTSSGTLWPKMPIYLTAESCGYVVGAVLSHRIDGKDCPIAFTSSMAENLL